MLPYVLVRNGPLPSMYHTNLHSLSGVSAQLVHYLVRLSAQWVPKQPPQLVRGQCTACALSCFSKFGHSACNNWPHPGNEPSVQTSVQAWSWHMHNLYATWTCLMFLYTIWSLLEYFWPQPGHVMCPTSWHMLELSTTLLMHHVPSLVNNK